MHINGINETVPLELRKPSRSPWALATRTLVAVLLVTSLLLYYDFSEVTSYLTSIGTVSAVAALIVLGTQYVLSSVRWHYIVVRHGQAFTFRRSFSIYGIGALANLVLVTSLAGVSVRGLLLVRENVEVSRVVGVLLAERIAALGGMVLCVLLGLVISHRLLLEQFSEHTSFEGMLGLFILIALAVLAGGLLLWRLQFVRQTVSQMRQAFLSWRVVSLLVVASSAIIFLGFAAVALLATGMRIDIDPVFFVTAMPVVAFMASLPITVGGWGVREGMMVVGLGLFGVQAEPALALSVAYGMAGIVVNGFFGAIALIWYMAVWRTRKQPVSSPDAGK